MIGATTSTTVAVVRTMLLLLLAAGPALSFVHHQQKPLVARRQPYRIKAALSSSPLTTAAHEFLQGAEILELTLPDHRPLGCTVEESLGKRFPNIVFCSKVTPDGFAEKAGVHPGDVFLGVSGMFGNVEDVTLAGIDRV